ncbi:MAG: methyltransferase domain-containing protein [Alphaproteobacteria bacterium]|nr:methyltransferase domain-containing protein [Alphaproteobacteria bacterium]
MPAPSARRVAAGLLSAVLDEGRTLDDALARSDTFAALEGRDRAFARAIVSAALRRLGGIDLVLARFLSRPLPESATLARALLRTAAAQLLVLGTPAHAVVSETVSLANAERKAQGFAKLMNAVLRKVAGEGPAILDAAAPGVDLPAWLSARWRAAYGGEAAAAMASALLLEPATDLTAKTDAAAWAERLGAELTPTGSLRLPPKAAPVPDLPGFAEGAWWVQDAAAALPARLLGEVRGQSVADLCAAPGGKTLQLAAAGAKVTAIDIDAARLERVAQNLKRARLEATLIAADAGNWSPAAPFDAVLLDAPCSATGTLRRHPDAAWLRRPGDIPKLSQLQRRLLDAAARMVKPGGLCVYAVCSLEPEEGPAIVTAALGAGAWRRKPLSAEDVSGCAAFLTPEGDLRTTPAHWPERGGLDGFYAARLERCG